METGKVIGMLCKVCKQIIKINDKNHICSFGKRPVFQHIKPKTQQIRQTHIPKNIFECLSDTEEVETAVADVPVEFLGTQTREPEPDDDDDSETMAKLISLVYERHPLWDHRLPLSARFEPIKKILWNEIYVELNGIYSIDILKNKWRYLREKYTRENKKPKSGSGGEKRRSWVHMQSLQFLDDVSTKNKKTTSNFSMASDLDSSNLEVTPCKRKKDELSFQEALLKEMQASRPIPPQVYEQPQEVVEDHEDASFAKYVVNLMKHIPRKRKIKLQSEIISKLVESIDL